MATKTKLNRLDRAIGYVFPRLGVRRAADRAALGITRSYEAASRGARTGGWRTTSGSANAEIKGGLGAMRDRSSALVRDNPYIERGVRVIQSNMVGDGIVPNFKGRSKAQAEHVQAKFKLWAESTECDADGLQDFYMMQGSAARSEVERGESLVLRVNRRTRDGLTVPMQIRLVEGDHIDDTRDTMGTDGKNIFQGVEFDKRGRRKGYWMFKEHPGDPNSNAVGWGQSSLFPARDVGHIYRVDRPGQVRGVPWTAPIMIRTRDFDEYEDAQLLRQKISACYAAFIYDADAPEDAVTDEMETDSLQPGLIERLPSGKRIEFANPPGVDGYGEYTSVMLHSIASGLGTTYEQLTGDMSEANFTQARMGLQEFHKNLTQWRKPLVRNFCDKVVGWFLEAMRLQGEDVDGITVEWTPPRREMLDPAKEITPRILAIRAGLASLSEDHRSGGRISLEVLEEIAESNKMLDKLGLILTSDPRQNVPTHSPDIIPEGNGGTEDPDDAPPKKAKK